MEDNRPMKDPQPAEDNQSKPLQPPPDPSAYIEDPQLTEDNQPAKDIQSSADNQSTKDSQPTGQLRVEKLIVTEDKKTASAGLSGPQAGVLAATSELLGEGKGYKAPEIEYALPNICCRCGKKEATEHSGL